jgi:predicted nucleic acid-binding protein
MYLVDTNVWLERLLDQAHSAQVGQFLNQIPSNELLMSDFTFHLIGVVLDRLSKREVLPQFADGLFAHDEVTLVSVQPEAIHHLVAVTEQFNLDFDDAYT